MRPSHACPPQQEPSPLFVDVGANLGWMAALAAHWGCRVIAFEPQVLNPDLTTEFVLLFAASPAHVLARDVFA